MIKLILWDLGNVVILADHVITHARLVSYGVPVKRAVQFYRTPAYAEFARGLISGDDFYFHQVNEVLKTDLPEADIIRAHDEHMWGIDEDVLFLMRRANRPIAVATDTNLWQTLRERQLIDISTVASKVIRSHELGKLKRDPGAFAEIVQQLGVPPEEIVLIDDSPEKVSQAANTGLQTILFQDAERLAQRLVELELVQ